MEPFPTAFPEVGLVIEHTHATLQVDTPALQRLIHGVLKAEGRSLHYLGIILTDHETVLQLNKTYLAHAYLTDVLSFPMHEDESEAVDGEVYVDLDTAFERHSEFGVSFEDEARRYVVHGLLHLLGYDDATPEQKRTMHDLEDRYLAAST